MLRHPPVKRCLALLVVALLALTLPLPAHAAPAGWAEFDGLAGEPQAYTTAVTQQPAGFPAAEITSNSAGGGIGRIGGSSTWLSEQTPPGQVYGSSRDQSYLNLRPNRASGGSPSVTTYTFERPTPSSGWTFVLGDIDADQVTVSATDADGAAVGADELGFEDVFNYCDTDISPRPGSCSGEEGTDLPSWDGDTQTLTGNEAASDTAGAAGWFQPTVALSTLTFEFDQRSGRPVYQTWFSALEYELAGTVTAPEGSAGGIELTLLDPQGTEVGSTTTADDGSYSFGPYATYDGYQVSITRPTGLTSDEPLTQTVDLSQGDQTEVDFTLREIVPVDASGQVVTPDDDPVPGATVTLTPADGGDPVTVTTEPNGSYSFEDIDPGDYTVEVAALDGFTEVTGSQELTVPEDSEEPVTVDDLVLAPVQQGSVTGAVTDADDAAVPGALVTLTGPEGLTREARTDADGSYQFDELDAGDYTVTVTAPDGAEVVGEESLDFSITEDGENVVDQDFQVAVPEPPTSYDIGGTVLDTDDAPVPGTGIVVTDLEGDVVAEVEVGSDGGYEVSDLPPADYQVTVVPPTGFTVQGQGSQDVDLDDEDDTGVDFVLVAENVPGYAASGTVLDPDGQPADGVTLVLSGPDDDTTAETTTDDDGTFSFENLSDGEYELVLEAPEGFDVLPEDPVDVLIDGDDVADLNFLLVDEDVETFSAGGTVLGPDAEPVPGTAVLVSDGELAVVVPVAEDGGFVVDVPAGRYSFTVVPPEGFLVQGDGTLEVTIDADVDGIDFALVAENAPGPEPSPEPSPEPDPSGPPAPGDGSDDGGFPDDGDYPEDAGYPDDGGYGAGPLAETGGPVLGLLALGGLSVAGGLGLLGRARLRR